MSDNQNLSSEQFKHVWKRGTHPTEDWRKAEVSETPHGRYLITGDGYGRMRWTVEYPDGDYAITDSRADARANADVDLKQRQERAARKQQDETR